MSLNGPVTNHSAEQRKAGRFFRFQAFTSLTALVLFLMVALSGIILYISPRGRVANWGQWTVWGWDKESWAAFHINATIFFVVFTLIHLLFNWKMLMGYLKRGILGLFRGSFELLAALILGAVVFVGTMMNIPPFFHFVAWRESFKDYWEKTSPPAAIPHLEEFTLGRIAALAGVDNNEILEFVKSLGVEEAQDFDTLAQIAARKGTTPRDVFQAMSERFPSLKALEGGTSGPRRGQGGMGPGIQNDQPAAGPGAGRGSGRGMGQGLRRGRMNGGDF